METKIIIMRAHKFMRRFSFGSKHCNEWTSGKRFNQVCQPRLPIANGQFIESVLAITIYRISLWRGQTADMYDLISSHRKHYNHNSSTDTARSWYSLPYIMIFFLHVLQSWWWNLVAEIGKHFSHNTHLSFYRARKLLAFRFNLCRVKKVKAHRMLAGRISFVML